MVLPATMGRNAFAALRASTAAVRLRRGQILCREGDPGGVLYLVVRGKLKVGKIAPDGRERLLEILGPGEAIGEVDLFDPGPRVATVTAVTDASLLRLDRDQLRLQLSGRPTMAEALLGQLARRLRVSAQAVADLTFLDVPGRVAKTLLDLAARFGAAATDGGVHVAHDLTQEELAQLVGASRESVNKALADFAARGWVRLKPRAVVIVDVRRMRGRVALPSVITAGEGRLRRSSRVLSRGLEDRTLGVQAGVCLDEATRMRAELTIALACADAAMYTAKRGNQITAEHAPDRDGVRRTAGPASYVAEGCCRGPGVSVKCCTYCERRELLGELDRPAGAPTAPAGGRTSGWKAGVTDGQDGGQREMGGCYP